jgi:hypothetical protein
VVNVDAATALYLRVKIILVCVEEFDTIKKVVDEIFVSFVAKKKLALNEERKRIVAETKL